MKKRILVDGHVLDGKNQGTCTYIAGIYTELSASEDFEIFLATQNESSFTSYFGQDSNINWIPMLTGNRYKRLAFEFDRLSEKVRPHYSHFQYITPFAKRSKWINTIHDTLFLDLPEYFPLFYRVKNHFLYRVSAMRSDCLLTVSNYSRGRIATHFGIEENKIGITPNGVEGMLRGPEVSVDGLQRKKYFIYVSRFEPRKNQHGLIDAFLNAGLPHDVKLVLVGARSLPYQDVDRRLFDNESSGRIVHLQGVSLGQLRWLYKNAAASIYPSKGEGFGMPPIEAAAMGCPTYCANNTALSELRGYVSGLFDAHSIEDMIRIFELHANSQLDGFASRESVISKYSWKSSAEELARRLSLC